MLLLVLTENAGEKLKVNFSNIQFQKTDAKNISNMNQEKSVNANY